MRTNSSHRSNASTTAWSLALVGFLGLVFWYLGWLPVSFESPATGTLADNAGDVNSGGEDSASFLDSFDLEQNQAAFNETDPVAFNSQDEPPVVEGATDDSLMLSSGVQPPKRDFGAQDDPPFRPPGSLAQRKSSGTPDLLFPRKRTAAVGSSSRMQPPSAAADRDVSSFNVKHINSVTGNGKIVQTGGGSPGRGTMPPAASAKLREIDDLLNDDERLAAHRELSTLYWVKPEWRPHLQTRIEQTARSIYFAAVPHYMQPYEVQSGDTLQVIARQYNVPWEYLVRLNRVDSRRIRPGQRLKVIKGPFSARIDLSDMELTLHAHGYFVRRFRVGIGKDGSTPVGRFKVMTKLVNPTYYGSNGEVIDAADPQNPLGERWIDIGDSYGIHGTINPESVGRAESRGCIRLLNEDVEVVYDLLGVGSEVVIRK